VIAILRDHAPGESHSFRKCLPGSARAIANLKLARAEYHSPPCEYRHWRRGKL
jgi:hypothetical protein